MRFELSIGKPKKNTAKRQPRAVDLSIDRYKYMTYIMYIHILICIIHIHRLREGIF